jgi:hypothetical protein
VKTYQDPDILGVPYLNPPGSISEHFEQYRSGPHTLSVAHLFSDRRSRVFSLVKLRNQECGERHRDNHVAATFYKSGNAAFCKSRSVYVTNQFLSQPFYAYYREVISRVLAGREVNF